MDSVEAIKTMKGEARFSVTRGLAAALILLCGAGFLAFTLTANRAANKDFVTYWAAGRQLLHRANPYDAAQIFRLEREAGCTQDRPYFMRNPPTALVLALPFGWMSEQAAAFVWSLLLVVAVMLSVRMTWAMQGRPAGRLHLAGYLFPPVLACMTLGQVGILLLLGITAFLAFHQTRPAVAGLGLALCAIKPHIFIPVWVVLVLWCVRTRAYRVLATAVSALGLSALLVTLLDPVVWRQYGEMMRADRLMGLWLPTTSFLLRMAVKPDAAWVQFVPAAAASVWVVWLFRRSEWRWREQGLLLLTVSMLVAPYAFVTDECVVLPAILAAAYRVERERRSLLPFAIVVLPALVEVLTGRGAGSFWYVWTAPAWVALCIYGGRDVVDESGTALIAAGGIRGE